MKKKVLLTIFVLALSASTFGQKAMSVRDYFLSIPTEFIQSDPEKRASWIYFESPQDGALSYDIPIEEVIGEKADGKVFGDVQVFKKRAGGVFIGISTNICENKACVGQVLFLDYNSGKWKDITSDLEPSIDNDEVINILRNAPAFDKPLEDKVEVPLFITFSGQDKVIQYIAGGENGDGGVVAKMFKWNGKTFVEFEYEESPE